MNAIFFDERHLDLPIPEADGQLLKTFERHAREILEGLSADDSHSDRAGKAIAAMLKGEPPSIKAIAGKMGMSVRNLQLKLQQEGTHTARF